MRSILVVLAAGIALAALVSPVHAMSGGTYEGPIGGTYVASNGATGTFDGSISGSANSALFNGYTGAGLEGTNQAVSGYIGNGSIGFVGTYNGIPGNTVFSGKVYWATEPLAALAVGFGLLGVRFLRRRS